MSWFFQFVGARRLGRFWTLLLPLTLLAVPCLAQTVTPDASSGSVSAPGSQDSSGVPGSDDNASSEKPYSGPSLLSRDASPSLGLPQVRLAPSVEISGVYDSGVDGLTLNSQGGGKGPAAFGTQYALGLTGTHGWRHARLAFHYSGSTTRYVANPYNNSNQTLTLSYMRTFSAHTILSISEAANASSRSFEQPTVSAGYLPALNIYGNRTSSFSTQIALTRQQSARLSFSVAGFGGLTHQASSVAYDIGTVGIMADAQYRLSMYSTAGVSYSFSHYIYPGSFSSTDYHNVSGNFALALSRRTEFSFSAGFMRSQSRYLQTIPLAPLFAFLIGSPTGVVIHRQVAQLPWRSTHIPVVLKIQRQLLKRIHGCARQRPFPGDRRDLRFRRLLLHRSAEMGSEFQRFLFTGQIHRHRARPLRNFRRKRFRLPFARPLHACGGQLFGRSVPEHERRLLQPHDLSGAHRPGIRPRRLPVGAEVNLTHHRGAEAQRIP